MPQAPASLLIHRGHERTHLDLILANGGDCLALTLTRGQLGWRATWNRAHRRRYLEWSGPLPGYRGRVLVAWRGCAYWHRQYLGWRIHLAGLTTLSMRRGRLQFESGRDGSRVRVRDVRDPHG